MDEEVKAALCETYRGMAVEDIEAAILASKHAARVPDPRKLAEYLLACCDAAAS